MVKGGEESGHGGEAIGGMSIQKEFWVRDRARWLGEVGGAVQCQRFD